MSLPDLSSDFRLSHIRSTAPLVSIEVEDTQGRRSVVLQELPVILGRGGNRHPQITDPAVSRVHALLFYGEEGLTCTDLESRHGLWHHGRRVPWARLAEGDIIRLGPFTTIEVLHVATPGRFHRSTWSPLRQKTRDALGID